MFDASFWVGAAFVLFFVAFGRKLWTFATGALDRRADAVRQELEEALRLREEAQSLLATYQRRQREAAAEAEAVLAHAREAAARIAAESEARLEEQLARRARAAEEKIAQMEARAAADIRAAMIDSALAATGRAIAAELDATADRALVARAVGELENRLAR